MTTPGLAPVPESPRLTRVKIIPGVPKTTSYEHLMRARPVLLWALERSWTADEARHKGCELDAEENSAWLVLEGRAGVVLDCCEHVAGPGEWMFPKPGARRQWFAGPFRFLSVTLRWQWPDGRHVFDEGLTRVVAASGHSWLEAAGRAAAAAAGRIAPDVPYYLGHGRISLAQSAELHAAAGTWAAAYCRIMDGLGVVPFLGVTQDPRITELLERIRQEVAQVTLDRAHLSAATGWSPRQMDRVVKAETGLTIAEFHDANRYEHACRALLVSGQRIKEVAATLGFRELACFSRWFARRSGRSPRVYRESFATPR